MEVKSSELEEKQIEKTEKQIGFWKRQFQTKATKKQKIFDWTFGVVLPVICFSFDPIFFKGDGMWGGELFGTIKPFAYLLSFVSIMAMMAWLIWGEKLGWFSAVLSGLFGVGGIISLIIGVVLIPFSLLGLIILIGILGFTPLFTSFVYLRNASRAFKIAKPFTEKRTLIGATLLSALFSFVVPFTINMEINQLLNRMISGDAATIKRNAKILKFIAPIVSFKKLAIDFVQREEDSAENRALAEAFFEITGQNITDVGFRAIGN